MDSPSSFLDSIKKLNLEDELKTAFDSNVFKTFQVPKSSTPYIDQKLPRQNGDELSLKQGYDDIRLI